MKKAVLEAIGTSYESFQKGDELPALLDFQDGPDLHLEMKVIASRSEGIFVEWRHDEKDSASRLQTLLVDYSTKTVQTPAGSAELTLRETILGRTTEVESSELAKTHRAVRVLNMGTILKLIRESVEETVERSEREWEQTERDRLLREAQEIFQQRMDEFRAQREDALARSRELETELKRTQELLEEERNRVLSADQFTVSDAGMVELESRLERLMRKAASERGAAAAIQEEMRNVVSTLLDEEREKILEKAQSAQSETISVLEHKVKRLAATLEETTRERDRAQKRASALEASSSSGVAGMAYKIGLDDEDADRDQKLRLLRSMAEENREVRSYLGQVSAASVSEAISTESVPEAHSEESAADRATPEKPAVSPDSSFAVKKIEVPECG